MPRSSEEPGASERQHSTYARHESAAPSDGIRITTNLPSYRHGRRRERSPAPQGIEDYIVKDADKSEAGCFAARTCAEIDPRGRVLTIEEQRREHPLSPCSDVARAQHGPATYDSFASCCMFEQTASDKRGAPSRCRDKKLMPDDGYYSNTPNFLGLAVDVARRRGAPDA